MTLIQKNKHSKIKKILLIMVCLIPLFLVTAFATEAAGTVDLTGLKNGADSIIKFVKDLSNVSLGVLLVVCAIGFMAGGQQGKQWAKPFAVQVLIGYAAITFVTDIATGIKSWFV